MNAQELATLLRLVADGEATPDQQAAFEQARQRDPSLAKRLDHEAGLRAACARSLGAASAPADLRERLARSMREAAAPESPASGTAATNLKLAHAADDSALPSLNVGIDNRRTRTMRWSGWLAAAAVALAAGGVWLASPSGPVGGPLAQAPALVPERTMSLVQFTTDEHSRCAALGTYFDRKMQARSLADAQKAAIELLSKVPGVLALRSVALEEAGYEFAGLGPCHVPGAGRSAHIIYKANPTLAPGAPNVSLFIQEDMGDLEIEPEVAFRSAQPDSQGMQLTVWRSGGLNYYLVAPQQFSPEARKAVDMPSRERTL